MANIFDGEFPELLKEEIQILCEKFDIKEMVIIAETSNEQTLCLQHTPDRANQVFNTFYETINGIFLEAARKGNHHFKRF